jgi:hypothetical protein
MFRNMRLPLTKLYLALSWLPLALYIFTSYYVDHFEGWGAWAAGRTLIYPLIFSVVMGLFGIVLTISSPGTRKMSLSLALATLLAGSVGLWFLGKAILLEMQRSF